MFGIVLSALNVLLGWVFRSAIIKFALFFGLFFVTVEFTAVLTPFLPNASGLSGALGGIPAGVWYFLDLFNVSLGIPMLLSAYVTRFVIRRLPVIG